jgi:nitrate reductase delta subunit
MTADSATIFARSLAALARLLEYPGAELQQSALEVADVLTAVPELQASESAAVREFLGQLAEESLYEAQARYVDTFDRGRKVSLYIFEHVYGESRDRGPAMIELKRVYREHGLEVESDELPDFLPIVLEFCAQLPRDAALEWLVETTHVLQPIRARLVERGSGYASAFTVLLRLIGADPAPQWLSDLAGKEVRDDTPAAIDAVWMEKPVTFGPGEALTNDGATRQRLPEPDEVGHQSAHSGPGV